MQNMNLRFQPRPDGDVIVLDPVQPGYSQVSAHTQHPTVGRILDRVLSVQRPIVLAHLRRLRAKHPHAHPAEVVTLLEKHYLTSVTLGGAGVGAAAAIPAVGTVAALAIAGGETAGFIEATALYAHAIAEIHGIVLTDRDRTHALILALMLGDEGATLLRQLTGQVAGGAVRTAFWGEVVTKSLPRGVVAPAVDQLRSLFLKKLAKTGTASVIGKAIPFGVGAVVGGTGNRLLGTRVVKSSRQAFGPAPALFPEHLRDVAPKASLEHKRAERKLARTRKRLT